MKISTDFGTLASSMNTIITQLGVITLLMTHIPMTATISHSGLENGRMVERRFEQPRLMPAHWSLLGRSRDGELLMPEENNKNSEQQQDNEEITDDGNYSRPTGTSTGSVFITSNMLRGISSSPVQLHHKTFPDISNFAYLQVQDSHSNTSPLPYYESSDGRYKRRTKREPTSVSDALSSNITAILESLLQDYDKTERPAYNKGETTKVRINILIRSMGPISEEDMNYSMDCYFRQYWNDKRLRFPPVDLNAHGSRIDQLSLNVKMLEKIWKPDTYFHNGLSSYLHTITRPNKLLRISENGDITYSMRLTIKAKCPMMLRSFPMDWQSCPLVIGSFGYNHKEVSYVWKKSKRSVDYEGKLQLSQFDIMQTEWRALNFSRGISNDRFSVLQVVIELQRHTGYFLIQIYLPCTLLVVLSWVGFWLNREATSDRVGLGITTVLTLSTIALDSRTDLPKVHYATALDWFIITCFFYCIATLLEFAGVHYFTKVGSGEVFSIDEPPTPVFVPKVQPTMKAEGSSIKLDENARMAVSHESALEVDDSEEWQDVDVSEEWGTPITPSMATTTCCDVIEPHKEFVNIVHKHHHPSGKTTTHVHHHHLHGPPRQRQQAQASASTVRMATFAPSAQHPMICEHNHELLNSGDGNVIEGICGESFETDDGLPSFEDCLLPNNSNANNKSSVPPPPPPPRCTYATAPPMPPEPSNGMDQAISNNGTKSLICTSRNQCSAAASAAAAAAAGFRPIPNSISMPSVRSNPASAIEPYVVRQAQAQTQTERKLSCLKQFLFCLLANQVYRKERMAEAALSGNGQNSTSKIDSVARILFPASFGFFNMVYWYSYFQAQKPFDWGDHWLRGNVLT